jgi:hypothetical protein
MIEFRTQYVCIEDICYWQNYKLIHISANFVTLIIVGKRTWNTAKVYILELKPK